MIKKIFLLCLIATGCCLAQNRGQTRLITTFDGLPSNLVYSFTKDKEGYIWFATDNGVAKYNGTSFKIFTTKNGLPTNDIFGINTDSKNRIWLDSYQDGLFYMENDSVKPIKGSENCNGYRFLYEKNNKIFFFSLKDHGLFLIKNGKLIKLSHMEEPSFTEDIFNNKSSVKNEHILRLLDDNGNQWIIDKSNSLYHYKNTLINSDYINAFSEAGISHDIEILNNKAIILNEDRQLYYYDFKTKKTHHLKDYRKNRNYLLIRNKKKVMIPICNGTTHIVSFNKNKPVSSLHKTFSGCIGRYSDNIEDEIYTIHFDRIQKINPNTLVFHLKGVKLRLNHIKAIDKKNIIVSNENEVYKINLIDNTAISNFSIKNTITINHHDNNILLGTSEGLKVLNKDLKKIAEVALKTKVSAISIDEEADFVYLISDLGIIILDKKYRIQKIINQFDGLPNKPIIDIVPRKDELLVLHSTGFSTISKKLIEKTVMGTLDVISFTSKGSDFDFHKKIKLRRTFNDIIIENSIKTIDNIANFEKYYALSRNDKPIQWIPFKENHLNFKNLASGDYKLWLGIKKLSNTRIIENKAILFSIQPFFWETNYFIFFIIFSTFLLTYYAINIYKKRVEKRQITENKLSTLEIKAMKSQMNPHFIFNSLNNIQSSFLLEDQVKANSIFVDFSKLLRTTLEMVNREKVTLEEELIYIKNYIAVIQSNHNTEIEFKYTTDNGIETSDITLPVLIIQPIIENAIMHGLLPSSKEKRLTIHIKNKSKETIVIEIMDNGIGRKKSQKRKSYNSYGTSIIKNRINLLNKILKKEVFNIKIIDLKEKNEPLGTLVRLQIPKQI